MFMSLSWNAHLVDYRPCHGNFFSYSYAASICHQLSLLKGSHDFTTTPQSPEAQDVRVKAVLLLTHHHTPFLSFLHHTNHIIQTPVKQTEK